LRLFRDRRFDTMEMGHRNLADLALNELGIHASRAYDLVRLAEGLETFPTLGRAFEQGRLGRCHVIQVLKVAEPDTVDGWILRAEKVPVRTLRLEANAFRRRVQGKHPEEEGEKFEDVEIRGQGYRFSYLEIVGRDMVERVEGRSLPLWRVMESLCAEFWSRFAHMAPLDEREVKEPPPEVEPQVAVPSEEALRQTSGEGGSGEEEVPEPEVDLPDPALARDAWQLVEILQALMARRQSLDWRIGRELVRCRWLKMPVDAEAVLGRSVRWARDLSRLYRRLEDLPGLREAYLEGRVGRSKALQVMRIATRASEEAWVRRAERVTFRGLRNQVAGMIGLRNLDEKAWLRRTGGGPPDPELMSELQMGAGGYKPADWRALEKAANIRSPRDLEIQAFERRFRGANTFRAPPEVAKYIKSSLRAMRKMFRTANEGEITEFLVDYFITVHDEATKKLQKRHAIFERDNWMCVWPGCSRRDAHKHHLEYLSQGGERTASNETTLCPVHHQAGQHAGRIRITGKAPDGLVFRVGKRVYRGEELIAVLDEQGRPS
jgi:hypothetical protein